MITIIGAFFIGAAIRLTQMPTSEKSKIQKL